MSTRDEDAKTRRTVLRAGLAAVGGVAAVAARAREQIAQDKVAPAMVQYQPTPKNNQMCSNCVQWAPPNACKIVSGTIAANGWCALFAPKAS